MAKDPRWTVVYHLRSVTSGQELRLKTDVSEGKNRSCPAFLPVWRTAKLA